MRASDRDSLYVYDSYERDISFFSVHGRFDFKKVPLIYSLSSVNKYLFTYVELYARILFSPFAAVSWSLYLCLPVSVSAPPPPHPQPPSPCTLSPPPPPLFLRLCPPPPLRHIIIQFSLIYYLRTYSYRVICYIHWTLSLSDDFSPFSG